MISLKKSLSDFDRLEAMQKAASECYRAAVATTGEHVVETDKSLTRHFREELESLSRRVRSAETADELSETRISFAQHLEEYARQGSRYLRSLKEQVTATRRALADVVDSLAQGEDNEQPRIEADLTRLEEIANRPAVRDICPEMSVVVASIGDGVIRMKKKNQLVVAQLRDELHSLQTTLDKAQQNARRDERSGLMNRVDLIGRIRQGIAARKTFALILVSIRNGSYLTSAHGGEVMDSVLDEFAQRLPDVVGPKTVRGHWNRFACLTILDRPKSEALELADRIASRLAGPYFPPGSAGGRTITLRLATGVVEAGPGDSEGRLLATIEKLLAALESTPA
jgi:GGDEF domain-containing protein